MFGESAKARRYERLYPGTGIPEAQKEERMEREDLKRDRREHRRTNRSRGIIVPGLPWLEKED